MPKIALIHPDLGIGGAERLVVDVAHAVKIENPDTVVWTSHYDPKHCFPDTKELSIKVRGSWIPRHIFGFGHIVFSLFSNLYLTILCAIQSKADIFIVDQVSAWLPILKLLCPRSKIIFYCHFPDLRLASHNSLIRRIYRIPFDFLESFGIKRAHLILVNSHFTAGVVEKEFGIKNVKVLYPCVKTTREVPRNPSKTPLFVSINRYERKKDHPLAIKAFAEAHKQYPTAKLIICGGYDERVIENVQHYRELSELVDSLKLRNSIELRRNISDVEKWELIGSATAVIYTPQNEHFGIVPIEAISVGTPVIACNSGGPCESVNIDSCYLCEPMTEAFSQAMIDSINTPNSVKQLKEHAKEFGFDKFQSEWNLHIKAL